MTTLVTADLHLAENPRDAYRFKFLEETLPALIRDHDVTRVFVLGDLCEVKDHHRAPLVNRIVDGFAALTKDVDLYVLKGNHDYVAEDVPFYRFLQHLDRVKWINEPLAVKLRGLGDCLFLPHTKHLDDWVDYMFDSHDWFFCHQTFAGAKDRGYVAEGEKAPFTGNAKVISGDVHVPQKLGPVTYVGSPYLIDFGDSFDPRVLILNDEEMKSVSVPGPQKRLMTLSGLDPLGALSMKHPFAGVLPQIQEGDVVKVKVELSDGRLSRAEVRAAVTDWAHKAGVTLYETKIIAAAPQRTEKKAAQTHRTDDELVRAYAKRMGKDDKTTLAAGLKVVEETA